MPGLLRRVGSDSTLRDIQINHRPRAVGPSTRTRSLVAAAAVYACVAAAVVALGADPGDGGWPLVALVVVGAAAGWAVNDAGGTLFAGVWLALGVLAPLGPGGVRGLVFAAVTLWPVATFAFAVGLLARRTVGAAPVARAPRARD